MVQFTLYYTHITYCRIAGKSHPMMNVAEGSDTATSNVALTSYYMEFNEDNNDVNLIKRTYK